MKRLNEKTNEPFKMRDVRKDGYIFDCYITSVKQKMDIIKKCGEVHRVLKKE